MNLNSFPSPFPIHQTNNDDDQPTFGTNYRVSSSSSSLSCRTFFDSTQDHMGYYDPHQPYQLQNEGDDKYAYCGGSSYEIKDNTESGLKLTLWKKDDDDDDGHDESISDKASPVKWMSSKMRLMKKMKRSPDRLTLKITSSATTKLEDHQKQQQQQQETDLRSNSSYSYNNINSPVRVCADCNTTKTPLWRSGPKGPKSLCNACGIRQRKARRAMAAAAAAAASGTAVATSHPPPMKIKVHHHKEKSTSKNIVRAPQFKKRSKTVVTATSASGSPASNGQKKLGFEDFLINLSNKLAYHRVFPEDERDAAILLMALSSGLVHG